MTQNIQHGVQYGCSLAGSATPGMVVTVGVGDPINSIINGNVSTSVSTTSVTISASDTAQDRYDLISANTAGIVTATTGALGSLTAGTCPQPDTTDVKLGYVPVAAGVTAINTTDIQDIRSFVVTAPTSYRVSGNWYGPSSMTRSITGTFALNNILCLMPYYVQYSFPVSALAVVVAATANSACTARLGFYIDDGMGNKKLLVEAGTASIAATGNASVTASVTLAPGIVWRACALQGIPGGQHVTLYVDNPGGFSPVGCSDLVTIVSGAYGGIRYDSISGALPTTLSSPVYNETSFPAIAMQAT